LRFDRSIYAGKKYLPLALVEGARGCQFKCDFCAIQTVFNHSQTLRPIDEIVADVNEVKDKLLVFFVDDNITSNVERAKEFLRALIPLNIRWVSQTSINVVCDEELLRLLAASGCEGMLIGLESLNAQNLKSMNKGVNLINGGFEQALENLRRYKIRLYATFVFGYDEDTADSFGETVRFAKRHKFYVAAFNHLVPFPGTPLYKRLEEEGRLLYEKWWLDDDYGFYMVPFQPASMSPERLEQGCFEARVAYYRWRSIWQRGLDPVNRASPLVWLAFYWINYLFRQEVRLREHYPLGDKAWKGELIKVRESPILVPTPVRVA
jgi:radical SAM superfamily enzyme YgiQ (UPF0313 family)